MYILNSILLILISLVALPCSSQSTVFTDTISLNQSFLSKNIINPYVQYMADPSGVLSIDEIKLMRDSFELCKENEFNWPTSPDSIQYAYWLKFYLENEGDSINENYYFHFGQLDSVQIWVLKNDIISDSTSGGFLAKQYLSKDKIQHSQYTLPVRIDNFGTYEIFVRIRNTISYPEKRPKFEVRSALFEQLMMDTTQWPFFLINGGFLAILIFVFLLSIYQYSKSGGKVHFYYAGYLLSLLLFFLYRLEKSVSLFVFFSYFPDWYYLLEIPLTGLIFFFYVFFIYEFLNEKRKYFSAFYKNIKPIVASIILYVLFFTGIGLLYGNFEFWRLFYESRYIRLVISGIFVAYFAFKIFQLFRTLSTRYQYINLFLIGTLFLIVLGGIFNIFIFLWSDQIFSGLWLLPLLPVQIGILFEIFFYSLALIYKEQVTVKENLQIKLDNLVSLLKPHFITNALNNLEDLIYEDQRKASDYILLLSNLFKDVITHSQNHFISLEKELRILKNYLEIQQVRFPGKFKYFLKVDKSIDLSNIFLPPLVLQPHLENSIKYGFNRPHFKGDGLITLTIKKVGDQIWCSVEDNGIGRKASRKFKFSKSTGKGIRATEEIIYNTNLINKTNLKFEVIDKYDSKTGEAKGTQVNLLIPEPKSK